MNKYQFKTPTPTGLGTSYYYCYGDNSFEDYLNLKNMKYKKLEETDDSGRNLFNEKDKEIERLNNIINKIIEFLQREQIEKGEYCDFLIENKQIKVQDVLDKLQEFRNENDKK